MVTRETLVMIFGLVVVCAPSLGVPTAWKQYVLIAAGTVLMVLGYSLRRAAYRRRIARANGEMVTDSFVESASATHEPESV